MSKFQQKHYEVLAQLIRENFAAECPKCLKPVPESIDLPDFILRLTRGLAADNPHFNYKRFLEACGR